MLPYVTEMAARTSWSGQLSPRLDNDEQQQDSHDLARAMEEQVSIRCLSVPGDEDRPCWRQ